MRKTLLLTLIIILAMGVVFAWADKQAVNKTPRVQAPEPTNVANPDLITPVEEKPQIQTEQVREAEVKQAINEEAATAAKIKAEEQFLAKQHANVAVEQNIQIEEKLAKEKVESDAVENYQDSEEYLQAKQRINEILADGVVSKAERDEYNTAQATMMADFDQPVTSGTKADFNGTESFTGGLNSFAHYSIDGVTPDWTYSAYTGNPSGSAYHTFGSSGHNEDDYLISEGLYTVPNEAGIRLYWEEYTTLADYYFLHRVGVATAANWTGDPATTTWDWLYSEEGTDDTWLARNVSLESYRGVQIKIAFNYQGEDADNWYIDNVSVAGEPTGACCVNEVCVATNTESECDGLTGTWYQGGECPTYVCPPENDWNCTDNPPTGKTGGGDVDTEPNNTYTEAITVQVGYAYCGDIDASGDEDWYVFTLPTLEDFYCIDVRMYADDTPYQYAYGTGLDPTLYIYSTVNDTTRLYTSGDHHGTWPDAVNYDSQIDCNDANNCFPGGTMLYIRADAYTTYSGSYLLVVGANACYPPTGRCCDYTSTPHSPTCNEDVYEDNCIGRYKVWVEDGVCPCPEIPANDFCSDATHIGDGTYNVNNTNAFTDSIYTGSDRINRDVWYCYTAPGTGLVAVDLCGSDFDTRVAVWEGCACPPTTRLAYNDDNSTMCTVETQASYLEFSAVENQTYLIQCGAYSSNYGNIVLTITSLAGATGACCYDDPTAPQCVDEVTESQCENTYSGYSWVLGASCEDDPAPCPALLPGEGCAFPIEITLDGNDSYSDTRDLSLYAHDFGQGGEDVVYEFTPTTNISLVISTCNSSAVFDDYLIVQLGSNCGTSTYLATADYGCDSGDHGELQYAFTADTTYIIVVDCWSFTDPGEYTLELYPYVEPTGRCCYYDEDPPNLYDPLCQSDVTEPECDDLIDEFSGVWTEGLNCVDNPCPVPPANDNCSDAMAVVAGDYEVDNTAATTDSLNARHIYKNVWFCYTAGMDGSAVIDLCETTFDTKLAVFDSCSCDPLGEELAYNDDDNLVYCDVDNNQSALSLNIESGHTYLIEAGNYYNSGGGILALTITEYPPCIVECPEGATIDEEPVCYDEYVDVTNGGCSSTPPVFGTITDGETICGTSGVFASGTSTLRDMDWFEITIPNRQFLHVTGMAEFSLAIWVIEPGDEGEECSGRTTIAYDYSLPCSTLVLDSVLVEAGTYWIAASTYDWGDWECGGTYYITVNSFTAPPAPANDLCDNATPVTVGTPVNGTTFWSTIDDEFPTCVYSITAPGVWYSVIGTGNTMTASLCGTPEEDKWDSRINVYCNSCDYPVCVDGDDDDCDDPVGAMSTLDWCTISGTEYLILVHGYQSYVGDFELIVTDDGIPCEDPVSCEPPQGRCCYGEYYHLDCANSTEQECDETYMGDWTAGYTCEDNPCPIYAHFNSDVTELSGSVENSGPGNVDTGTIMISNTGSASLSFTSSVSIDPPPVSMSIPRDDDNKFDAGNVFNFTEQQKDQMLYSYVTPEPGLILQGGENCSDYYDLGNTVPVTDVGSTTGMTNDYPTFSTRPVGWQAGWYSSSAGGPDVTYKFTAPVDSFYNFTLCNSGFDTVLLLYRFTCPTEPTLADFIAGNDDGCSSQSKVVGIRLVAGQSVLVVVDGYGTASGDYELVVDYSVAPPSCPPNTLVGQPSSLGSVGYTSDVAPGYKRYDNYGGAFGTIEGIRFWGVQGYYDGSDWSECTESPVDIEIGFYEDDGGLPGTSVYSETFTFTPVATIWTDLTGSTIYEFDATFATPVFLASGWVSIQGVSDPADCWFLNCEHDYGDVASVYENGGSFTVDDIDLAFCLTGTYEAPWLTIDVESGVIPVGDPSIPITATMDASELECGHTYTGKVNFTTNDPNMPTFSVPVAFDVCVNPCYQYVPGDANMFNGQWPVKIIGGDVTYMVAYFRGINPPCLVGGFWNSADANGDCIVIGSDVTRMVAYFRGLNTIGHCPNYEPCWLTPADTDSEPRPNGWPNCETPPVSGTDLPSGKAK